MGIQINGNTDNISATDGGLSVSGFELNQTGVSTFHSHLHVADQIIHLDDSNSKIRFPAADTITAETAGTERLRITSDGEVKIMNTSGTVGLYFQSSSGAVSNFRAIGTNNQSLGYFFGNTERVRFTPAGKVGINSTAPTNMLDVVGTADVLGIYRNDYTGTGGAGLNLNFGGAKADGSLFNCAKITAVRGDNTAQAGELRFSVLTSGSMSEKLRIDSSGRVLIGKISGDHILDINASSDEIRLTKASVSDYTGIQLDRDASGNAGGYFGIAGNTNHYITNAAQHDICVRSESNLLFSAGGATERLRIRTDGKVTIGTNIPSSNSAAYMFTVADPTNSLGNCGITIRAGTGVSGGTHQGSIFYSNATSGTGEYAGYLQYNHNDNWFRIGVNSAERLRVDSNGRVMIGTNVEGYGDADDLTIANASNTGITIRSGASNYGSIFFSDATSGDGEYDAFLQYGHSAKSLAIGVASATKMTIYSNGQVATRGNNTGNPVGMELKNENTAAYSHAELTLTSQNATSSKIWCDVPNARLRMQYNGGSTVDIDQSGNIHVPSGSGISFAASGNFSLMNSEVLDDYEEGYWTPTIGGHAGDGSTTYGNQKGSYVRVGGIVHLNWYIAWSSTTASGQFRIYGMPYNTASTYGTNYNITTGSMMFDSINVPYQYGQMVPYLAHAVNQIVFYSSYHTGGWSILSHDSYTANGGAMIASISYRAA